jgi:hypothetical protein
LGYLGPFANLFARQSDLRDEAFAGLATASSCAKPLMGHLVAAPYLYEPL